MGSLVKPACICKFVEVSPLPDSNNTSHCCKPLQAGILSVGTANEMPSSLPGVFICLVKPGLEHVWMLKCLQC